MNREARGQPLPRAGSPGPPGLRLVLGKRVAGSASLPVWLALSVAGLPFAEAASLAELLEETSPPDAAGGLAASRLMALLDTAEDGPVLWDGGSLVWGALPILEHLAGQEPTLWPSDPVLRARARSVVAELQGGFAAIRALLEARAIPGARLPARLLRPLARDLQRLRRMIAGERALCALGAGPFLFGRFSVADAMLAGLDLEPLKDELAHEPACLAYLDSLTGLAGMRAWIPDSAKAEPVLPPPPQPPPPPLPVASMDGPEPGPSSATAPLAPEPPAPGIGARPPAPPPAPPPAAPASQRPDLEEVDHPPIAYLDEPKLGRWRRMGILERIVTPLAVPPLPTRKTRSGTDFFAPAQGFQAPVAAPSPRSPVPQDPPDLPAAPPEPARSPSKPPDPGTPEPQAADAGAAPAQNAPAQNAPAMAKPPGPEEADTAFLFRRRPGTAGPEGGGASLNRFARALGAGPAPRTRDADPSKQPDSRQPPLGQPDPGPPEDGGPPRPGRRPTAIKPIGFSTLRRR